MGCSKALIACVASLVTTTAHANTEKPTRPKPGDELAIGDLAWPASTKSAEATATIDVVRKPGRGGAFGKLARGTRVAWKRIVAAGDGCKAYLEIEPRGFVCAKQLAPSDLPPAASDRADPSAIVDRVLAKLQFAVTPKGTRAYPTASAIKRGGGTELTGWKFLHGSIDAVVAVGGELFVKTIAGYVAAQDLMARPASTFAGVTITPQTRWPFGWVVPKPGDETVTVRSAPSKTAPAVKTVGYRVELPVFETDKGFTRVGPNEWIAADEIAVAASSKRPDGVRADERWLDVDLDENVLVAYAGDQPVFATLVSTGFGSTPVSLHRITKKHALMTLVSPAVATGTWNLPDVPFMMEFRKYYGLHAAYWHDSFGKKRGHGCVNLSPRDAKYLYELTLPAVPPGWAEASATGNEGTPIRIRNRANPNPPWTEFDAPPPVPIKDLAED